MRKIQRHKKKFKKSVIKLSHEDLKIELMVTLFITARRENPIFINYNTYVGC